MHQSREGFPNSESVELKPQGAREGRNLYWFLFGSSGVCGILSPSHIFVILTFVVLDRAVEPDSVICCTLCVCRSQTDDLHRLHLLSAFCLFSAFS